MQEHGQTIVFLMTVAIFAAVMTLVLKRKITERFAILWTGISIVLLLASSIGFRYLFKVAQLLGIVYPPSALFLLVIFGLTLLMIELFTWVSKLNERTRALSQQLALLQDRLDANRRPPLQSYRNVGEMPEPEFAAIEPDVHNGGTIIDLEMLAASTSKRRPQLVFEEKSRMSPPQTDAEDHGKNLA
jgi:hypothetical protein